MLPKFLAAFLAPRATGPVQPITPQSVGAAPPRIDSFFCDCISSVSTKAWALGAVCPPIDPRWRFWRIALFAWLLPQGALAQTPPAPEVVAAPPPGLAKPLPGETLPNPMPAQGNNGEAERQQAHERFENGIRLFEEGDYALALLEFERAHTLVPDYRVLYNIGQVNIQLGRYARAIQKLHQYLVQGGDQISASKRSDVAADLEMLGSRTATILVELNVPGAEIMFDNDVVAISPMSHPALVDAGEHRLTVRKANYSTEIRQVALAGRDQLRIALSLTEEPPSLPTTSTIIIERRGETLASPTPQKRDVLLPVGWAAAGSLAVAWAATGYLGYNAAHERQAKLNEVTSAEELSSLKTKARNWYLAADVIGSLTLATTGAMIYYTFFVSKPLAAPTPTALHRPHLAVELTPSSCSVTGSF